MSSEVCPFCGKIYKRLKSHLPHCKAAASPNTPPTKHVAASETASSSSQLVAPFSGPTAESTKTLSVTLIPQSKKGKKMSTASLSPDSSSLPPPTKKTKQKPSQQIKRAVAPSSITDSLVSIASPPPPVPKKQSLRALIEAAKAKHATEGTGSASEDRPPGSAPSVADPLSSGATKEADAPPAVLSAADEPTAASERKVAKTKKAAEYLSATRGASNPPDSRVHERDDFWVEDENGEVEELSVNKRFLKSGSGHKARITLQDVKATLGRANGPRQPGRPSILSQVETTDNAKCKIAPVPLPPPAAPLLTGQLSSLPRTVSVNGVPKVTGVLALSPTHTEFTNPLLAARGGTLRAGTSRGGDGLKLRPGVREQNAADRGTKGGLAQRSLAQVKLRELPEWLTCRTPSHPREVVEMVQGGWQWYYKKYIDVKKGGAGGLGMLLAGYCALSYIWSYPHMKRDRWRKYH